MLELKRVKHVVLGAAFTLAVPTMALAEQNDRNDRDGTNDRQQKERNGHNERNDAPRQQQPQQDQQKGSPEGKQADVAGEIRGEVESVDIESGKITIRDAEQDESVELRAKPGQLAQAREGQRVMARYGEFNDERWLMENMEQPASPQLGQVQSSRGEITEVDSDKGELTVRTADDEEIELKAHPAELQQIREGQQVSFQYQTVGDDPWITGLQEMPEAAPANQGAQPRNGNDRNDEGMDRNDRNDEGMDRNDRNDEGMDRNDRDQRQRHERIDRNDRNNDRNQRNDRNQSRPQDQ